MIRVDIIAAMLEDKGLGLVGQDIFYFSSPEGVTECLLVLDNMEATALDEDLPGHKKSRFRVVVRRTDYIEAVKAAKDVVSALDFHRQSYDVLNFQRCKPEFDPIPYPLPASDVVEISCNFWACYTED